MLSRVVKSRGARRVAINAVLIMALCRLLWTDKHTYISSVMKQYNKDLIEKGAVVRVHEEDPGQESEDIVPSPAEEEVPRLAVTPDPHRFDNWRNLSREEVSSLSVLGRHMFLGEKVGKPQDRNFTILLWKTGHNIEKRMLYHYTETYHDPFGEKCPVHNCKLSFEDGDAATADAIIIHLHRTRGYTTFPNRTRLDQPWIFHTDESPRATFMMAKDKNLAHYNGYFNWSMTYRMDSDVPVPYGRTMVRAVPLDDVPDFYSQKNGTVAAMGSNCGGGNKRWAYVRELKKHMQVDAYGGCGTLKCPGHFKRDCPALTVYKFYLAFENNNCKGYITEKVWHNSFLKGAVPVVMGAPKKFYEQLLPPHSFLHVDDFETPRHLAATLTYLASDREAYMSFHAWRRHFYILQEHGYFQMANYHYCRVCQALNYNSMKPKTYNDLKGFWDHEQYCYPATWMERLLAAETITSKQR